MSIEAQSHPSSQAEEKLVYRLIGYINEKTTRLLDLSGKEYRLATSKKPKHFFSGYPQYEVSIGNGSLYLEINNIQDAQKLSNLPYQEFLSYINKIIVRSFKKGPKIEKVVFGPHLNSIMTNAVYRNHPMSGISRITNDTTSLDKFHFHGIRELNSNEHLSYNEVNLFLHFISEGFKEHYRNRSSRLIAFDYNYICFSSKEKVSIYTYKGIDLDKTQIRSYLNKVFGIRQGKTPETKMEALLNKIIDSAKTQMKSYLYKLFGIKQGDETPEAKTVNDKIDALSNLKISHTKQSFVENSNELLYRLWMGNHFIDTTQGLQEAKTGIFTIYREQVLPILQNESLQKALFVNIDPKVGFERLIAQAFSENIDSSNRKEYVLLLTFLRSSELKEWLLKNKEEDLVILKEFLLKIDEIMYISRFGENNPEFYITRTESTQDAEGKSEGKLQTSVRSFMQNSRGSLTKEYIEALIDFNRCPFVIVDIAGMGAENFVDTLTTLDASISQNDPLGMMKTGENVTNRLLSGVKLLEKYYFVSVLGDEIIMVPKDNTSDVDETALFQLLESTIGKEFPYRACFSNLRGSETPSVDDVMEKIAYLKGGQKIGGENVIGDYIRLNGI